ncbi:MAG: preprotein translocase subunit SecY [Clostridia bacterium]|nr:preprotein translocase subunit SecY [Clostridia bacterium]
MFETLKNAFKVKEIRTKILITLALVLVYRIGCFIPVPGIDSKVLSENLAGNTYFSVMSAITGGSLSQGTLFAMGIGPYINSSIIIQLLSVAIPSLERLSKQGEEGRKQIAKITRYVALALAVAQALGILLSFGNGGAIDFTLFGTNAKWATYAYMTAIYAAGSLLTVWIGERITEYGVSNGISMLIFVGILSTAGTSIINQITLIGSDDMAIWRLIAFLAAVIVIFCCIVYVDLAERKIPVQYAKQVKGRKMYGGQNTVIPIRVNANGVMPLIFAFAILSFPDLIFNMFWPTSNAAIWWAMHMGAGSWPYNIVLALLILGFAYFYAQIQFNPDDISKSIQQNGGFIPGIRPGKPTAQHLRRINNRITLFGAIFLALIALVPTLIFTAVAGTGSSLINAFSATGMLIIVSVALEFDKQLQSQIMMKNYKGFLK